MYNICIVKVNKYLWILWKSGKYVYKPMSAKKYEKYDKNLKNHKMIIGKNQ